MIVSKTFKPQARFLYIKHSGTPLNELGSDLNQWQQLFFFPFPNKSLM